MSTRVLSASVTYANEAARDAASGWDEGDVVYVTGIGYTVYDGSAWAVLGGGGAATLAEILAEGNDTGGIVDGDVTPAILSVASVAPHDASVSARATATGESDAYADRTATSTEGDAYARTIVTTTGGEDAVATAVATTFSGEADASNRAEVTDSAGGNAFANSTAESAGLNAEAKNMATASGDGDADASSVASANADGDARVYHEAQAFGAGIATAALTATSNAGTSGIESLADATSARMGFNGATPIARPELPASPTEQDIADVLVALGLVTQAV